MQIDLGKFKGTDGQNCYIRYSASEDGSGMEEYWREGLEYIGFAVTRAAAPQDPAAYRWCRFIANSVKMSQIKQTTGTSADDIMSQKAVTDALSAAVAPKAAQSALDALTTTVNTKASQTALDTLSSTTQTALSKKLNGVSTDTVVEVNWDNVDWTLFNAVWGADWRYRIGIYQCRGQTASTSWLSSHGFGGTYSIVLENWLNGYVIVRLKDSDTPNQLTATVVLAQGQAALFVRAALPTGTASQVLNGQGTPITPTASPTSGSSLPFTAGGAFTELAKKVDKDRFIDITLGYKPNKVPLFSMNTISLSQVFLVMMSMQTAGGNSTNAKILCVRGFYNGAENQDPTGNIQTIVDMGVVYNPTWGINENGYLTLTHLGNEIGWRIAVISNKPIL